MGKKKENKKKISIEEKKFLKELKKLGYGETKTLGYILYRQTQKVADINLFEQEQENLFNSLSDLTPNTQKEESELISKRIEIQEKISKYKIEILACYKFIDDCLKYNYLFKEPSDNRFISEDLSETKVLKVALTLVLQYSFVSMKYTKVYNDYSTLFKLKKLLGDDFPNLLNRVGDYALFCDKSPAINKLLEAYCRDDVEKQNFYKWLSDNGYQGLQTTNEIISKVDSILEERSNNEELVKQDVDDYLFEIFSNLSERNIENLNYIIAALKANALYETEPYIVELFVNFLYEEISKPNSKLKENTTKKNLSFIETAYQYFQNENNKEHEAQTIRDKITKRKTDKEEKKIIEEKKLAHNHEGYSQHVENSLLSEEEEQENKKLEEEKAQNADKIDRQLALLKKEIQNKKLKKEQDRIQQEKDEQEAKTRKKEKAEKEVEKVSTQIKSFLNFIKEELNNPDYADELRNSLFLKLEGRKGFQTIEEYFDTLDCKSLVSTPVKENVIYVVTKAYDSLYFEYLLKKNSLRQNSENNQKKDKVKPSKLDELKEQFEEIKKANNGGNNEYDKVNSILAQVGSELKRLTERTLPQKKEAVANLANEIRGIEGEILGLTKSIEEDKEKLAKLGDGSGENNTIELFLESRTTIHKSIGVNLTKLNRKKRKLNKKQMEYINLVSKFEGTKCIIRKFKELQRELSQFIHSRSTFTSEQLQPMTYSTWGNQQWKGTAFYSPTIVGHMSPEGLQQLGYGGPCQPTSTGVIIPENEQGGTSSEQQKTQSDNSLPQETNESTEFLKRVLKLDGRKTITDPISHGEPNPFLLSLQSEDSPISRLNDKELSKIIRDREIHFSQFYTPNIEKQSAVTFLLNKKYYNSIEAMMPGIYKSISEIFDKYNGSEPLNSNEIATLRNCCNCFNEITKSGVSDLINHSVIKSFNSFAKNQSERTINEFEDKHKETTEQKAASRSKSPKRNRSLAK